MIGWVGPGTSCVFVEFSWKQSKSFRIFLFNQKLARALTSTPKAIAPANTSCCLATSGTNTAGSVPSRRQDFVINWYLFPRLDVWTHPAEVEVVTSFWRHKNTCMLCCLATSVILYVIYQTLEIVFHPISTHRKEKKFKVFQFGGNLMKHCLSLYLLDFLCFNLMK